MALLSSPEFLSPMSRARTLDEAEAEEEMLERNLTSAAHHQVAEGALGASELAGQDAGGEVARQVQQASLHAALVELENEPADAAASAAKFELYEGFAKLTEDARTATLELWAQSSVEFDGAQATKAHIEREIARVDQHDNLGIREDPRKWFVHGMCNVAARNQQVLNGVLSSITTKLDLLSSQTECPICFETFGPARAATTLGCAHKACEECWSQWQAVCELNGGPGFCPLCRHEEFIGQVLRAAEEL